MLNRRTLRIKVMQTFFAYKQRVQANNDLAEDFLKQEYSPDLNSMEIQDSEALERNQKMAIERYRQISSGAELGKTGELEVEEKVDEARRMFEENNKKDAGQLRNHMISDVEKLYHTYISFLDLLIAFQEQATLDTKRNHSRFVKNLLIRGLQLNKSLEKAILDSGSKWRNQPEVKDWLRTLLAKDEIYIEYNLKEETSFADDYEIVKYLVNKVIFKNEVIETFLEESDIHWDENRSIIKSLIIKTLKTIEEADPEEFDLQQVSYNFEEDREFFVRLFDTTMKLPEELKNLIGEKAQNWDIDRLALTDRIALEMAMSELINFPSIPIKVTINEYIEVSKKYSTPKSKQFINGILDVIADDLQKKGIVKKSGRGLIDNK